MSDLDNAINSINASAAKAENTAGFLDDMSTFDDQSSVTNPNNGQTVASIPKQVKDRTDELFTAAESDINQSVSDAAQSATDAQDAADSIGRYQGLWPDTGGIANKGDTYQTQVGGAPTGQYFTALQNTTVDPVGDDVNWREVVSMAGKLPNSVKLLNDMLASAPQSGEKVFIVEQAGVGGTFYWDPLSTETPDNVIVYQVPDVITGRFKRQWEGMWINALWAGVLADATPGVAISGTDNSPAQLLADEAGFKYNVEVKWPCGYYRFTQPFQRKTVHSGVNYQSIGPRTTFYFDNPTPTTWLTSKDHGSDPQRSHDLKRFVFISAQTRIHKLFDGNVYKGLFEDLNCVLFDTAFDLDCVYAWFKRCSFSQNNRTVDFRSLRVSQDYSTMGNFEECVFLGNNIGFEFRDRNLGSTNENDNFIAMQFTRCGFEQNTTDGLKIGNRVWYLKLDGCWSEANGGFGLNIADTTTDTFEVACRWDDAVNRPSLRYYSNQLGVIRDYCQRRINYRGAQDITSTKSGTVMVKSDGTISGITVPVPCTAAVQPNNALRLTFQTSGSIIARPIIKCMPMKRNLLLSYAISVENTSSIPSIADFGTITECDIFCYQPSSPTIGVVPDWWLVEVSWASTDNTALT